MSTDADRRNLAPAPWDSEASGKPGGNGDFNVYIVDAAGRKIATIWGKRGEKEWTAALVTAAPDLLAYVRAKADAGCETARALLAEIDTMAANNAGTTSSKAAA